MWDDDGGFDDVRRLWCEADGHPAPAGVSIRPIAWDWESGASAHSAASDLD